MSETVGEGVLKIRVDDSAVGSGVTSAGAEAGGGYTKGFLGNLKGLALGVGAVLAAKSVLSFASDSVAEAREAQKVGAATEQIIKATGSAANLTSSQIGDLASSLSAKTAVDDEQIQAGANLLLTFKNVKREGEGLNDVFGRATAAGLDLAASGFGSVEGNAKMLGKALNDPVKGISALSRAGVTFTAEQQAQIKSMVENNDVLGAQKIILGEVEKQVGGVAEATATSGEKASVAFGNIKEAVGTFLLPVIDRLADIFVSTLAPAITNLVAQGGPLSVVFFNIQLAITKVLGVIDSLTAGSGGLTGILSTLGATIQTALATALPVVVELLSSLGAAAQQVLPVIADLFINQVLPAVTSLASYVATNLFPIFLQIVGVVRDQLIPTFVQVATFIYGTVYPALLQIATTVAEKLKPVFDQIVVTLRDTLIPAFSGVVEQIRTQLLPVLEPLIQKVIAVGGFLLGLAATILGAVLPPLVRLAGFLLANVVPAIVGLITFVVRAVNGLLGFIGAIGSTIGKIGGFASALRTLISGGLDAVVSAVTGLPGKITALGGKLLSAGKDIIGEFLKGLSFPGGGIPGIAEGIVTAVKGAINGLIDKLNGLLEFTIHVGPKSFTVNPPNIGHLQSGTLSAPAGQYLVGEVGPELVTLPAGARVDTAAQTRQQGTGSVDYDALAAAVAAALAPLLQAMRPITIPEQVTDPEAAAMLILNRLVTQ